MLKSILREEYPKNTKLESETDLKLEERGIRQVSPIYSQKKMEEVRARSGDHPRVRPLVKTEFFYLNDEDSNPQITTKESPYTATELAKLKREYGHLAKESETEYVWRVSLTGGDQIQPSEKEA
ncbi:hypothetical protein FK515_29250, partial [Klebsiella pneumoniae]|nr:hypothetical protein [Klebsiella pneumoniae]